MASRCSDRQASAYQRKVLDERRKLAFDASHAMKCECLHCGGHIEFEEDYSGSDIVCPHCQQETRLEPGCVRRAPKPPTVSESAIGGTFYYLSCDGQESGPFYLSQIKAMWASGAINAEALWWTAGLANRQPILTLEPELGGPEHAVGESRRVPDVTGSPARTRMDVDDVVVGGRGCDPPSSAEPVIDWDAILPTVPTARRIRGSKTSLGGCALAVLGFFLLCLFPVGTVIGIALMIVGYRSTKVWRCSNCGNHLADEQVSMCAACHAHLGDPTPRWNWVSDSVPRRHTEPTWVEVALNTLLDFATDSCRGIAHWCCRKTRNQRDVLLASAATTFAVLGTLAFVWYSSPIAPNPGDAAREPAKAKGRAPVGGTLDEDLVKAQQQPIAEDLFSDPWYQEGVRLGEMFALEYHRNGFSEPAPGLFAGMAAARKNEPGFNATRFEIGLKRGWRNIMNMR